MEEGIDVKDVSYQRLTMVACSSRWYHVDESKTKVGWHTASKAPMNARNMTRPVKLCIAAIKAMQMPQRKMLRESHLAIGTRWMIQFSYQCMSACP